MYDSGIRIPSLEWSAS